MIRRSGRGLAAAALLAIALVAATPHPVAARPASPVRWANGACPTAAGVTVVVDFQQLKTESGASPASIVRCAPGSPSSGFDALAEAGISFTQVTTNGGFLCKIEGLPAGTKYANNCSSIPPTSAYWGYWVAARGGSWCYSRIGAGNRTPKQGTVEGWSFSTGSGEGTTPPRPAVPGAVSGSPGAVDDGSCPSPPTTTTTTVRAAPGTTAPPAGGPGPAGGTTAPTTKRPTAGATTTSVVGDGPPAVSDTSSTTSAEGTSTTSTTAPSGEVRIRDDDDGGGSPVGAIAGGVAVAGLGVAAALTARRRRAGP